MVPDEHVLRRWNIGSRERGLDKKGHSREGLVSNIVLPSSNFVGMRSCKKDIIMSAGVKTENLGLFLSKTGFLECNNVSIKSKDQGSIRSKGVTSIGNHLNPILQGVLPRTTLEYRG